MPFTIRLLGPARYGLWSLLQLSLVWAALADVGMQSASKKFGAACYATGDDRGESVVVWSAMCITAITTAFVAVLAAIEAPLIVERVLRVHGALLGPGTLALRIICGLFVLQSITYTVNTPQLVRLRWRQYTIINVTSNLIGTVGIPVVLVTTSGGLVSAAALGLFAVALGAAGNAVLAARLLPALRRPAVSKEVLGRLLRYGGALMVGSMATIPLTTAERFFLAHNHSTVVVAYYAVAATVATTLTVLPQQLVGPLLPGLTRLETEGRLEEHRDLYAKSLAGLFLAITPCAIMLAFLARPFLTLWAGQQYGVHSTAPLLVVVGGVWFNCFAWVPLSYLLSSGRTKVIAYIYICEVAPYLALAYLLTEHFGAVGAAMAWSANYVADSIIFFAVVRRVAHLPFSPLSGHRVRSGVAPVALGVTVYAASLVSHGLVSRCCWAVCLGVIYTVGVWRVVLTARERAGLVDLLAAIRRPGGRASHGPVGPPGVGGGCAE